MLKARWENLVSQMKASEAAGMIIMPGPNMFYLTGLKMGLSERPTVLVIKSGGRACFIMPRLEQQKGTDVSRKLKDQAIPLPVTVHSYTDEEGPKEAFNEVLSSESGFWALEFKRCRILEYSLMKGAMAEFAWVDADEIVKALRMVKDKSELDSMQKAAELADFGVDLARKMLEPNKRAVDIAAEIERRLKSKGAEAVSMALATGVDTSVPHAGTSTRIIEEGDLAWLDLCVRVDGYWADITRTYAIGTIHDELRHIYEVVLEAQERARLAAKPGMSGADIDSLARDVIDSYGYGQAFIHRTGHGLGLEIHEEPYVVSSNNVPLPLGSVVTIEPGIYLAGKGGVRIEDDMVVTASGLRTLTDYPRNLLSL